MVSLNAMDEDANRHPEITVYGREAVNIIRPELRGIINEDAGVPPQQQEKNKLNKEISNKA